LAPVPDNGSGLLTVGYLVYDTVCLVATVLGAPLLPLLRRGRHGQGIDERLGRIPAGARGLARPLWLHAASVGEVLSTEPLIQELRRHRPDLPIVVSTTSWTGRNTAAERLGADAVMLVPLDFFWAVRRCVHALRPRMLVIVETEIWPSLIREVARTGAPVALVSGRLSEAGARRYRPVGWFIRRVLRQLTMIAMQGEADAQRMRELGGPEDRMSVLGSLKFARDTATGPPRARGARLALPRERPIFVAASTQPREEEMVLDACQRVWERNPNALLLIAPRRPARFDEVAGLIAARGLACERRSARGKSVAAATQVFLLDTLGELADAFPAARAVYVGGSMGSVGGHNVLEPAVFARPVSFGPDTHNVEPAAHALLAAGAATRVLDANGLGADWLSLLDDPQRAERMGQAARAVVDQQSAVAERTAEALLPFLDVDDVDAEPDNS